jgi:hypothetical protein
MSDYRTVTFIFDQDEPELNYPARPDVLGLNRDIFFSTDTDLALSRKSRSSEQEVGIKVGGASRATLHRSHPQHLQAFGPLQASARVAEPGIYRKSVKILSPC